MAGEGGGRGYPASPGVDIDLHGALSFLRHIWNGIFLLLLFMGMRIHPLPPSVHLVLMGDVMLGRGIARAHALMKPGRQSGFLPPEPSVEIPTWDQAFMDMSSYLKRADLSMANLESPLEESDFDLEDGDDSLRYNLCAPAGGVQTLSAVGVDVLTLANNHLNDCESREKGKHLQDNEGLTQTSRILAQQGMIPVPGYQIVWKEVNTLPLALVALDDVTSPLDIHAAAEIIRIARRSGGIVIVSIHWGEEYTSHPSPRQVMLAQAMADAGALIIWGHHPHVLQQTAWLQGKGQPFRTLVAFSLGNALFDQIVPVDASRSALLRVEVNSYGIVYADAVPFTIDPNRGLVHAADEEDERLVLSRLGMEVRSAK